MVAHITRDPQLLVGLHVEVDLAQSDEARYVEDRVQMKVFSTHM